MQRILPSAVFTLLISQALAATSITAGPHARFSIGAQDAYSGLRACVTPCLSHSYIGLSYTDLGVYLGCGVGGAFDTVLNQCYCSTAYSSSASFYLNSCVSSRCGNIDNVGTEVASAESVYGGYCVTANVETSTTQAAISSPSSASRSATASSGASPASSRAPTSTSASSSEATNTATTSTTGTSGLNKSDTIAIAVGLGVGVPSLLIGAIGLCLQVRKRKRLHAQEANATNNAANTQMNHPHAYEWQQAQQEGTRDYYR